MRIALTLTLLLAGQLACAAGWLDWLGSGAVLDTGNSVVIAGSPDGDPAGAWTDIHSGDLSGRQLRLRLLSGDWGAVSLAEVILSTSGNFEEFLHVDLRALLSAPAEGEWIEVSVPAGAWTASPGADWRTVNALLLRVSSHTGATAMVGFSGLQFVEERVSEGVLTIAFDDGRSDVYTYAYPELSRRGLTATVFAIPELIGRPGYMNQQHLYELHGAGWEIGAHGEHPLIYMSDAELERHFRFASEWLGASGFGDRPNYAYPNGLVNERVVEQMTARFATGRTINAHGDVLGYASQYRLGGVSVYPEMEQDQLKDLIGAAKRKGEWLTVVFHLFSEDPEVDTQFGTQRFEDLLDFVVAERIPVMTTAQAWQYNLRIAVCGVSSSKLPQFTPQDASSAGVICE